ncbi:MAG: elongation factor P maturation arginine rhamnosyltransferase EarP, partial [Moraxellaceae bacterium]
MRPGAILRATRTAGAGNVTLGALARPRCDRPHPLPSTCRTARVRCDLFCTVIDNYGDLGVCWRLARQLAAEHGVAVTL